MNGGFHEEATTLHRMPNPAIAPDTGYASYPVGYHRLHADVSMNFQMNRWFGWVGEPAMLDDMRAAAARIVSYADWKREFVALAEAASRQGRTLAAGFYWRSAEFFMRADDSDRQAARTRFLAALRSVYACDLGQRHAVPYTDGQHRGWLPAYRFRPARAKCTVVFFGGFDSSIEELTSAFLFLREAGYDVIAFDGPGQGGALEDSGLPMSSQWHKPVGAVLDHFGVDGVTLIGLSLGGCLVMRAAAFEPRVVRVIAYDILTDLVEVNLRQTQPMLRVLLRVLLRLGARGTVNRMAGQAARKSPLAEWGVQLGMRVTGTRSAFEFFRAIAQYRTADVSAAIGQDVLLLAGSEDHYVPTTQLTDRIDLLKNARSVTARLFTPHENAQNHCQVGNYGLALRTIVAWLDTMHAQNLSLDTGGH
jgi:pimeloyl-ACP methyl ester carboxylesterase